MLTLNYSLEQLQYEQFAIPFHDLGPQWDKCHNCTIAVEVKIGTHPILEGPRPILGSPIFDKYIAVATFAIAIFFF